jgi:AraC-like DNA-binding protein
VAIKRHYRSPLTITAVARALASSPRQLQRAYAQCSDSTFHEDLTARRMDAAAELLSKPAIPVRDVAHRVGYCQPSHFARAFQRRYGVSPSAFRAELHDGTQGRLIPAEQPQDYDSCVGRVHIDTANVSLARVAVGT